MSRMEHEERPDPRSGLHSPRHDLDNLSKRLNGLFSTFQTSLCHHTLCKLSFVLPMLGLLLDFKVDFFFTFFSHLHIAPTHGIKCKCRDYHKESEPNKSKIMSYSSLNTCKPSSDSSSCAPHSKHILGYPVVVHMLLHTSGSPFGFCTTMLLEAFTCHIPGHICEY